MGVSSTDLFGCNTTGGWTRVAYLNMTPASSVKCMELTNTQFRTKGGYVEGAAVVLVSFPEPFDKTIAMFVGE